VALLREGRITFIRRLFHVRYVVDDAQLALAPEDRRASGDAGA
jgi:hypothetical protein